MQELHGEPIHRIVEFSHHLVPDLAKIHSAPYYWGRMDRYKAEELLEGKPEGSDLISFFSNFL